MSIFSNMETVIRNQRISRRISERRISGKTLYTGTTRGSNGVQQLMAWHPPSGKGRENRWVPARITRASRKRPGKNLPVLNFVTVKKAVSQIRFAGLYLQIALCAFLVLTAALVSIEPVSRYVNQRKLFSGQGGGLALPPEGLIGELLNKYAEPEKEYFLSGNLDDIDPDTFESLSLRNYTIKPGDTLSEIAKAAGLNMDTIISFNDIDSVRRLQVGAVYKIPNRDGLLYKVKQGDSLYTISSSFNVAVTAILDANNLGSAVIHQGQDLFIPNARMSTQDLKIVLGEAFRIPVSRYRFTSDFGPRKDPFTGAPSYHYGVDLAASLATPIYAAMEGRVIAADYNALYGNYIILKHAGRYQTLYGHLHSFSVRVGEYVTQGKKIGTMGNTGRSTGVHLHFSINKNGSWLDPEKYINF
ncbi:MAG: peptidoglycan DD-metalloendopeptidase family protein [Spirochaetia bacterium]